jgi:hypothetical protein
LFESHSHEGHGGGFAVSLAALLMAPGQVAHGGHHGVVTSAPRTVERWQTTSHANETGIDSTLGEHEEHADSPASNVGFKKLVPKPCTVSYSGGVVVTAVTGKRQCDCEQKQAAAEETARQIAGDDGLRAQSPLASLLDCLPCQQSALLAGLSAELQACSLPGIGSGALPNLENSFDQAVCPVEMAAQAEAAEAAWLQSLQYVGWPLLLASLAMIPQRRRRGSTMQERECDKPAIDWLFSRFQIELLLAR